MHAPGSIPEVYIFRQTLAYYTDLLTLKTNDKETHRRSLIRWVYEVARRLTLCDIASFVVYLIRASQMKGSALGLGDPIDPTLRNPRLRHLRS